MAADLRIRWHLELVGDPSRELLRQDRSIRSSITATERAQRKLATAATATGKTQTRASQTAATALQKEGRAAKTTESDVQRLNRAQAEALSVGSRLAASARRTADAYRAQGRAAREASGAERARAAASRAGSNLATGAAGAGAGLTRGTQAAIGAAAGGGVLAKTVATFAGFEQQMDRVAAVSGASTRELGKLNAQAKQLGADTAFSAREAADGMYQLSTAGFKANDVMRILPGTLALASASGTDLATSAELQAAAIRGFGLKAKDATRVADVMTSTVNASAVEMYDLGESLKYIAPVARASGQSMETMLAAVGLMGNVGIKGSQAGTTLRTAMVRLTAPTAKSAAALHDLGIKSSELRGPKGLLPLPQIMAKIADGARGMDKGTRNAALAAIFGREALSGMVTLVEQGPKALQKQIKALQTSEGQAKRTAKVMRDNVAGGWDQFTGSLETAAITLTERFGPALKDALSGAATGVNRGAKGLSDLMTGIGAGVTDKPVRGAAHTRVVHDDAGATRRVTTRDEPSKLAKIGAAVGGVARKVATAAADAGRQLLDAFKPALPFFQNVLLPLIQGVGEGILASLVGVFKVAVPVIRVVATALGFIGKAARPLRPVFRGIGQVIGAVMGGPILGAIGKIGRLGGVFKLLAVPIRLASGVLGGVGRAFGGAAIWVAKLLSKFTPLGAGIRLVIKHFGALRDGVKGAFVGLAGIVAGAFGKVMGGIRGAVNTVIDVVNKAIDAFNKLPFHGDISKIEKLAAPDTRPSTGAAAASRHRRGGRVRFQNGGLVDALVSPGELVEYGGATWTVPGRPVAADSVATALPAGARVFTADGQARLAGGMSPESALASQAPHFRAGGRVHPGRYRSTAYGPPWNAMNGTGVTRTGVNLRNSPRMYGVAVDPRMIPLGSAVYAWPNPFGYTGRFRAFDTGGAIRGDRLDFYDWRGRQRQLAWGHRNVTVGTRSVHSREGGPSYTATGGAGATPELRILGASRRRSGLLEDAFGQGLQAGQEGLTRGAIAQRGNPVLAALAEQLNQAGPNGNSLSQRYHRDSSSGDGTTRKLRSVAASTRRPYVYGGGHGAFKSSPGGLDCSGYVSHVLHYGGANPELTRPAATGALGRYGVAGRGRHVTIHVRNGGPGGGHAMLTINGRGYSSGNRRTGRLSGRFDVSRSYLATLPIKRHPQRLRAGGIVGGRLGAAAGRAAAFRGHSLEALDTAIGDATESRILELRRALLARVRRGGPQRVVQRFQAMVSLAEYELGRRVGRILDVVAGRTASTQRLGGAQDRYLRRSGIDPSSARGLSAAIFRAGVTDVPNAQANVRSLQSALARAKRAGNPANVRDLTTQLADAQDELDEAVTSQAERWRDFLKARAQEAVEGADHLLSLTQGQLSAQETGQRLAGLLPGSGALGGALGGAMGLIGMRGAAAADTPDAMRQRASALIGGLVPALEGQRRALEGQRGTALATGDLAGVRAAELALQSNANELATAVGDAAQLVRDAAVRSATDLVEQTASGTTLAQTGLARLELEQKLSGRYEGGGAERAAFIRTNVMPALQGELDALKESERVYREQGMGAELRQTIEAESAKQNEILQAQLDAQEETAENTAPLKEYAGTFTGEVHGETFNDTLWGFDIGT